MTSARHPTDRRRAFTLIELLVVVGVIAVIIGLLVPVTSSLRRRANTAACLGNLSEIARLLSVRAAERRGFCGLAGEITLAPTAAESLPRALDDAEGARYAYLSLPLAPWGNGFVHHLRPLPAVLAGLTSTDGLDSLQSLLLAESTRDRSPLRIFRCPAAEETPWRRAAGDVVIVGATAYERIWPIENDYAFNSTLFGFHYQSQHAARRLRGRWDKTGGATLVAVGDRDVSTGGAVAAWTVRVDAPPGAVSLTGVVENHPTIVPMAGVDLRRHGGRVNLLFADGHAESVAQAGLTGCWLAP